MELNHKISSSGWAATIIDFLNFSFIFNELEKTTLRPFLGRHGHAGFNMGRIIRSVTSAVRGNAKAAKTIAATFSGWRRRSGKYGFPSDRWTASCIGVAVRPGKTLKTRNPLGFTSALRLSAIALRACLVAASWLTLAPAFRPAVELMNTTCPSRAISIDSNCWVRAYGASTFVRNWRSKLSREAEEKGSVWINPALWTRMST